MPQPRPAIRRPRDRARLSRRGLGRAAAGGGVIEGNIGRNPVRPQAHGGGARGGKPALTRYRVDERFGEPDRPSQPGRMPAGDRAHPPDPRASVPSRPSADRRSDLWRARTAGAAPRRPAEADGLCGRRRVSRARRCMPTCSVPPSDGRERLRFEGPGLRISRSWSASARVETVADAN